MLSIFYIENNNGTLLITLDSLLTNKVKNYENYSLLYNDDKLVGINVFNVNKKFTFKIGLIYPKREILDWIYELTKQTLIHHVNFVVGQINECEDIPKTHLHKCVVSDGKENHNIVCGAKNARKNLKVVIAKIGSVLPNGNIILPGALMGFESNGMLCSSKELNLNIESNGIMELDDSYNVGDEFLDLYSNN